jgi:hypothetical protein
VRDDGRIVMERRKLAGLDTVPAYAVQAAPAFIAFTAVREARNDTDRSRPGHRRPAGRV